MCKASKSPRVVDRLEASKLLVQKSEFDRFKHQNEDDDDDDFIIPSASRRGASNGSYPFSQLNFNAGGVYLSASSPLEKIDENQMQTQFYHATKEEEETEQDEEIELWQDKGLITTYTNYEHLYSKPAATIRNTTPNNSSKVWTTKPTAQAKINLNANRNVNGEVNELNECE